MSKKVCQKNSWTKKQNKTKSKSIGDKKLRGLPKHGIKSLSADSKHSDFLATCSLDVGDQAAPLQNNFIIELALIYEKIAL